MTEQLTRAAENDSVADTRSAWSVYRKFRPRHKLLFLWEKKINKAK